MSESRMSRTPETKITKQHSVGPRSSSSYNPFESDSETDLDSTLVTPPRQLSSPLTGKENFKASQFKYHEDDETKSRTSSGSSLCSDLSSKKQYQNSFSDSGGLENQTVRGLESYAVYKAEETTEQFKSCLKIAEEIRDDAEKTLVTLHQQGEQITRTHLEAAKIDHDLSLGEKLLGSLGGFFSKSWTPKRTRSINGPLILRSDSSKSVGCLEKRGALGLTPSPSRKLNLLKYPSNPSVPHEKIEIEKAKQDDALSDLSNLLVELKDMAVDMGSEIVRQNKSLDHLHDDVDELNYRVKGANARGRRLLGK